MNTYDIGDQPRLAVAFTTSAGAATDPTTVTLEVKAPGAAKVTYTYGTGNTIVKSATGSYYADIDITASGTWRYRWAGAGALAAAEEATFWVRDRQCA